MYNRKGGLSCGVEKQGCSRSRQGHWCGRREGLDLFDPFVLGGESAKAQGIERGFLGPYLGGYLCYDGLVCSAL